MSVTNLQPHIRCGNEDGAPYAILPGDPQRVERIRQYLTNVRDIAFNREFKSISGSYKGVRVMAVSTGIGGASTGIAVEELHNIGVKAMIRIGSCGALQPDIRLGDLILINGAVRDDGASKTYVEAIYPAVPDTELLLCTMEAAKESNYRCHVGRARSHDSFYTDREDEIDRYWGSRGILGADMETAALFVIGGLRGVRTASILNTVVESSGGLEDGINGYVDGESLTKTGEEHEILTALEAILKINQKGC
ncbi:MAG TPA: nucleoside phosphorylase [Caproiciproducens sp.]|nr:nucleoside phosphorylase [Caproiciproducens sp.]